MALSDGPILDAQAGAETFGSALIAALAGVNSVSGPGMLDFLLVFSLPKLVFDDEMCGQALRFVREIEPNDDLPIDDLIRTLLADQHLIMAEHTIRPLARGAVPAVGDRRPRQPREQWTKLGAKDTYQRAIDDVERRLAVVPRARDRSAHRRGAAPDHPGPASRTRPSCRSSPRPRSRPRRRSPPRQGLPGGATRDVAADAMTTETAADPRIGRDLFDASIRLPAFVLRERALAHDIATLAAFCRGYGISFAPHGKTTMSPAIFRRQVEAGAWAITVAHPWQAEVALDAGVERILIANEVVDDAGLDWIGGVLDGDATELLVLADSVAGVERMAARLAGRRRRLAVLVDIGMVGGRTGVRTTDEAEAVAAAIEAADPLQLAGLSVYEGVVSGETLAERQDAVRAMTAATREIADRLAPRFARSGAGEVVITGGGSTYPDVVAEELGRPWSLPKPVRVVLRSGAYITHDHGIYERGSPFGMRAAPGAPRLEPAIEVWAPVLSAPEPGLAIAGAGRRDLPVDQDLPVVIKVRGEDGVVATGRSRVHRGSGSTTSTRSSSSRTGPPWPSATSSPSGSRTRAPRSSSGARRSSSTSPTGSSRSTSSGSSGCVLGRRRRRREDDVVLRGVAQRRGDEEPDREQRDHGPDQADAGDGRERSPGSVRRTRASRPSPARPPAVFTMTSVMSKLPVDSTCWAISRARLAPANTPASFHVRHDGARSPR